MDPSDQSKWLYEPITLPTEWVESYRPGGLHPVQLGDTFKKGRYKIIRKLGHGSFSTVWLAQDIRKSALVAVKITRADAQKASKKELRMCRKLENADRSPGDSSAEIRVVNLLDSFKHTGPNGVHRCFVFEPMGPSVQEMLEVLPPSSSYVVVKSVLKQVLLGLHFLHSNEIAHGDLNPGNILCSLRKFTEHDKGVLLEQPAESIISAPVRRKDGQGHGGSPKCLYIAQPLIQMVDHTANLNVKLSDLGSAFPFSKPPQKPTTPIALRAPEVILDCPISHKIDIWAFGCLIFEFLTGYPLFQVSNWSSIPQHQKDDDHLLQMYDTLGKFPESLFEKWARGGRYFGANMEVIRTDVGSAEIAEGEIYTGPSLEAGLKRQRPRGMDDGEVEKVNVVLRKILRYEAELRPSTAELLEDEWFASAELE
ncbi:hypothetical protein ONS95_009974 [Cadophora gregata]|uniref:uncharacterized protein n=1 Tax=Cadophora gregata TaxID=51156 RepID=UPI0026DB92A9|nr:uncharacterized protein ONS95_009974 [Cadophora gregata]KAK0121689.1 hypothetical protein ONS95_009974 [Cadophora gregata]KAK0127166.1 hypothetical protein ONS96_006719 [Cadophora gregata f. sp. sojae]